MWDANRNGVHWWMAHWGKWMWSNVKYNLYWSTKKLHSSLSHTISNFDSSNIIMAFIFIDIQCSVYKFTSSGILFQPLTNVYRLFLPAVIRQWTPFLFGSHIRCTHNDVRIWICYIQHCTIGVVCVDLKMESIVYSWKNVPLL